ncbi:MAG: LysM peptidoglycan-binding domain-containing protein [Bacteroidota bacterium]
MHLLKKLLLLVCILNLLQVSAQEELPVEQTPLQLGLGMGAINYLGDFTEGSSFLNRFDPLFNFSVQIENNKPLQFQLNVGFGSFTEQFDEAPPEVPSEILLNNYVKTNFFYGDLRLRYRFRPGKKLRPYVSTGPGLLVFSPRDQDGKFLNEATRTRNENEQYNTFTLQWPLTGGVLFQLADNFSMGLDYTYRFTGSDYLDNIGELGTRKGNDALHGLTISAYVSLKSKEPPMPIPRPPAIKAPYIVQDDVIIGTQEEENIARVEAVETEEPNMGTSVYGELAEEEIPEEEEDVFFYRVKEGDTFTSLSETFNVSVFEIKNLNQLLTATELPTGELIQIPGNNTEDDFNDLLPGSTQAAPEPKEKEVPVTDVEEVEEIEVSEEWGEKLQEAIDNNWFFYHQVKPKDTLGRLAEKYQIPISMIKELNYITGNSLEKGIYLRLPNADNQRKRGD